MKTRFLSRLALVAVANTVFSLSSAAYAQTDKAALVTYYADLAHAKYSDALTAAKTLDTSINAFLAAPSEDSLKAARAAWLASRPWYQQTEPFRFGNPAVDEFEGKVNAWPLDEGMIDYVDEGYGTESDENSLYVANVIANPKITINGTEVDASKITPELISGTLHEAGGVDANVASGYHAIEFLLWGQDLNGTGPGAGNRPYTDYDLKNCTHGNCDRRADYLRSASSLLVSDLSDITAKWLPGGEAAKVLTDDPDKGISALLTGIGSLSYGELAGERMKLGLLLHDPEEEHDCFSDNTHNSHLNDVIGIVTNWNGKYKRLDGTDMSGPSLADLVADKDKALADDMSAKLATSLAAFEAIAKRAETVEHYDQMIAEGNTEGNATIQAGIDGLIAQTKTVEKIVAALNVAAVTVEGSDSLDNPAAVQQ